MTFDLLCNLLSFLCLIAISSAVIWGIHGASQLTGFADFLDKKIRFEWVRKVIYSCPVCMPTFWTFFILLACGTPGKVPLITPLIVWLGTAGLNYILKERLYPEPECIHDRIERLLKEDPKI